MAILLMRHPNLILWLSGIAVFVMGAAAASLVWYLIRRKLDEISGDRRTQGMITERDQIIVQKNLKIEQLKGEVESLRALRKAMISLVAEWGNKL
jgi:hypothetical protein